MPVSKETSAKISVLVTILWTEPWICAQKLKFDHHKLSVILAVSPQIGCFFKTAPLLFLSSYWNGHVSVTIRWINHNIQSTGQVGLTSLWGSVGYLIAIWIASIWWFVWEWCWWNGFGDDFGDLFEDDFDEMVLKRSKEQITNCDPLENLENLVGHTFQSSVERETASRFVIF